MDIVSSQRQPSCAAPRPHPSATAPTLGARGGTPAPAPGAPGSRPRPAPRAHTTRRATRCRGSAIRGRQPVRPSLSTRARAWRNRDASRPACRRAAARPRRPRAASPPSGYGAAGMSSAITWPPLVLISTASMQSTPLMYAGDSWRVASPWSVITTNCSPARAAAAAIASRSFDPSDRVLWTWNAPATVLARIASSTTPDAVAGRGGSVTSSQRKTAARTAAVSLTALRVIAFMDCVSRRWRYAGGATRRSALSTRLRPCGARRPCRCAPR